MKFLSLGLFEDLMKAASETTTSSTFLTLTSEKTSKPLTLFVLREAFDYQNKYDNC